MKNQILLPNRMKKIGWWVLIPSVIVGLYVVLTDYSLQLPKIKVFALVSDQMLGKRHFFSVVETDPALTVLGVFFIIGALMVAFSKEKIEDEFIAELRLSSMLWAVLVSYLLLLVAFLFVYGMVFLDVMVFNMFTVLFIFITRFNYLLYKNAKMTGNEE